jgi:hypothetical protein
VTRDDLAPLLALGAFALFSFKPDFVTLFGFAVSLFALGFFRALPIVFDTRADLLRTEITKTIAQQSVEIDGLKSKLDMITLGRR